MIKELTVCSSGWIECRSCLYTSHSTINNRNTYRFVQGVNLLEGDIDCGNWEISYLLSMYEAAKKCFILTEETKITLDNNESTLSEVGRRACYLDTSFPLFSSKRKSVEHLIMQGLKKSHSDYTLEEIKKTFFLDDYRSTRPIWGVGNEKFRAMAAIALAHGKEIFCFPWLSRKMFDYYCGNITELLKISEELKIMSIVPVGKR